MSNRSYQTITLYGDSECVKEVIDYVISLKTNDLHYPEFATEAFPISSCSIIDGKILLETKYCPIGLSDFSKMFPKVGFYSHSFTDGQGEIEETWMLNGRIIYGSYKDIQGPEWWKEVTGISMGIDDDNEPEIEPLDIPDDDFLKE